MNIHTKFLLAWLSMAHLTGHDIIKKVDAQNWQDEEHVWNEEKGKFEVHNKAHGRVVEEKKGDFKFEPPTEEWARYLPRTVRYGKREATQWEIKEAQRKLWAKEIITVRAMQKANDRRKLMAYRKSVGWYAARRSGSYAGWSMQIHVNNVPNYSRRY